MSYEYKREPLRADEEQRLRGSARTPAEKMAVVVMLETGIRVSELAELELDQVDWQSRRLFVYGKGGENGHNSKRRVLPLSDECFDLLSYHMNLLEDGNRKILKDGTNVWTTIRTLHRVTARCANRARITRPVSPHVLRHTFAVNWLKRGGDIRTLQKLLGHESILTTMRYLNLSPEDVIEQFRRKWKRRPEDE